MLLDLVLYLCHARLGMIYFLLPAMQPYVKIREKCTTVIRTCILRFANHKYSAVAGAHIMEHKTMKGVDGEVHNWISETTDATKEVIVFTHGLTADHTMYEKQIEFSRRRIAMNMG
jgi:hypothetical protein